MNAEINLVSVDPLLLKGLMVFKGTRVPVESLFDHLEKGYTLEDFLKDFPSVGLHQAQEVMRIGKEILNK